MSLAMVFWLVFAATVLLAATGHTRRQAKTSDRAGPDGDGSSRADRVKLQYGLKSTSGEAPAGTDRPWRVGRKVGRTIYLMISTEPLDRDILVGMMDTRELATEAVEAHNERLLRRRTALTPLA